MVRPISISLVLVIALLLVTGPSLAGEPLPQTREYDSWRLADIRDIEPEFSAAILAAYPEYDADGELQVELDTFTLSPDGDTVIAFGEFGDDGIVCRYDLDSAEVLCKVVEPREAAFRPTLGNLSWSPDSAQIAMHEEPFRFFLESDIWLLDVAALTITNVTDDGVSGGFFSDDAATFALDYTPLWHPVTGDLYFFRSARGEDTWTLDLYRLPKGSTDAELALDLDADMVSFTVESVARAAMSPDGSQIVVAPTSVGQPLTPGIWIIDLAAGTMRPLAVIYGLQVAVPSWADQDPGPVSWIEQVAWGADGETVIVRMFNPTYSSLLYFNNYLAIQVGDGTVSYLADYESFGSADEMQQAVLGEEAVVPLFGIVAPDRGSLFYVPAQVFRYENRSIYAAPLPFGGEPVALGAIPSQELAEEMFQSARVSNYLAVRTASTNGRALVGTVLLTFE